MNHQKSDNLSKGDVISFIALLLMGVIVFFGMNFKTLGDKIPSIIFAVLLVVLMTVFVFLAAYAKAQNRNQQSWRNTEYVMLALYMASLVPCYLYVSKFFDIYFDKPAITKQVQADIDDLDKMFSDYSRKSESRCSSYETTLEALSKDSQGRERIAEYLKLDGDKVTTKTIEQAVESFSSGLKGTEYRALETEKNNLEKNLQKHIKNWNILFIPQYALEMSNAKGKFAKELEGLYTKANNEIEDDVPSFDAGKSNSASNLEQTFSKSTGLSIVGLLATLVLGGLGLVKYLLGEKRTVIEFKEGDVSTIKEDGGFSI